MDNLDLAFLEQLINDQSFVNWAKELDKKDIAKWEDYINGNLDQLEIIKAGRLIVLGIPFQNITSNEAQAKNSLATLLGKLDSKGHTVIKLQTVPRNNTRIYKIPRHMFVAVSVAVFMIISCVFYFQFFHSTEVLLTTGYGEQSEIQLPDGSTVILNSNSSLTYNSKKARVVRLEGEAFFKVEQKPETGEIFQVTTQDLMVYVLGTSFNVNARNDQTKIFLEEGNVELKIKDDNKEIIKMNPGDLITYSKKEDKLRENRKNVSVLENASWKDGALMFNKTPLAEALFNIEDIYGIHFVMESDELKDEEITGGVPIIDLKVTLETLNEIYGIQIRTEGKRYFLSSREE